MPTNYIVMGVFTVLESYLVSYVCLLYTPDSVLLAASATLAATVGLTYFAMTTKEDLTSMRFVGKGTPNTTQACSVQSSGSCFR